MALSSDMIRGLLDTMVLSLIKEEDHYGYQLALAIKERTQGLFEIKEASLYATLQRLEEKGIIVSYEGEKTHGKKRRYYQLSELGETYLRGKKAEWKELQKIMSLIVEKKDGTHS